jgi:integrase
MRETMKSAYRLFKRERSGIFYIQNNSTREQRSLKTKDKEAATRLWESENNARKAPALNLELGKVYLRACDPAMTTRTWQAVMDDLSTHGKESSQRRCRREMQSQAFALLRNKKLVETTGEDLRVVLKRGGSSANNYLRRLHNLAQKNCWITSPIIPSNQWEKPAKKPKRAITFDEHARIIAAEQNEERKHYLEMVWLIGSAQTDCSLLTAENLNWNTRVLSYQRKKTGEWCFLRIGSELERLLNKLPAKGLLFPKIASLSENDRAAEFYRRCKLLEIKGVSLHSYRYAWAERAYAAGYPERYAQAALGHGSRAVHHAYARAAKVVCPSLDSNGNNIVPFGQAVMEEAAKQVA